MRARKQREGCRTEIRTKPNRLRHQEHQGSKKKLTENNEKEDDEARQKKKQKAKSKSKKQKRKTQRHKEGEKGKEEKDKGKKIMKKRDKKRQTAVFTGRVVHLDTRGMIDIQRVDRVDCEGYA